MFLFESRHFEFQRSRSADEMTFQCFVYKFRQNRKEELTKWTTESENRKTTNGELFVRSSIATHGIYFLFRIVKRGSEDAKISRWLHRWRQRKRESPFRLPAESGRPEVEAGQGPIALPVHEAEWVASDFSAGQRSTSDGKMRRETWADAAAAPGEELLCSWRIVVRSSDVDGSTGVAAVDRSDEEAFRNTSGEIWSKNQKSRCHSNDRVLSDNHGNADGSRFKKKIVSAGDVTNIASCRKEIWRPEVKYPEQEVEYRFYGVDDRKTWMKGSWQRRETENSPKIATGNSLTSVAVETPLTVEIPRNDDGDDDVSRRYQESLENFLLVR